jgi:NAD(P)-dependent dehydrogenase (short-subunit alcohol dehydrogenase family)
VSIENRVAVITGATGSLGRVVAKQFAEQGARLALFGTNAEKLDGLARELRLPPERLLIHAVDLRNAHATQNAAKAVIAKFSRVDVLLNLVGGWAGGKPVVEFKASEVEVMLQQHLWTTFHLAQAFVPHLVANQWGRIIVVSSPTATDPPAHAAPYAIAKAAQEALMLTLAQELKDTGVTANILQVKTIDSQRERNRKRTPENVSWTTPEEIAATILYLCSDQAHVVNGARIPLFGAP